MRRLVPIAIVLALAAGCGASRPRAYPGETLDVTVLVHEIPSFTTEVGPSLRAEVVLVGLGGIAVGEVDLGVVEVDAASCSATDPSAIEGAVNPDDPTRAPRVELACSGTDTGWRVALIDRGDHVEIWTLLRDEDGGTWQPQADLPLPDGARARLHGEPEPAP